MTSIKTGNHGYKRLFCMLLSVLMLLSLSACGKNEVDGYLKNAWVAAGQPYGIQRVYHYAFQGTEALDTQAGGDYTLADGFAVKYVPENGHLFILQMGSNSIYVLENEAGDVLGMVDFNDLNLKSDRINSNLQTTIKTVNDQYAKGLITDAELNRKKAEIDAELDKGMGYATQMVTVSRYGLCAALCPVSAKAEPNSWHELTAEQLEKLWED